MKEQIFEFLKLVSSFGLNIQDCNGDMPVSKNGPHNHQMTQVRNNCHWSILFSYMYSVSGEIDYKLAAERSMERVLSKEFYPASYSTIHRIQPGMSKTNGLIGQMWTIEALLYTGNYLKSTRYLKFAKKIYLSQNFDDALSLWSTLDELGNTEELDRTFNQQIWTAYIGLKLIRFGVIDDNGNIESFINKYIEPYYFRSGPLIPLAIEDRLTKLKKKIKRKIVGNDEIYKLKEEAYNSFSMIGLMYIKRYYPYLEFFKTKQWRDIIDNYKNNDYIYNLVSNPFALSYNVSGFEVYKICNSDKLLFEKQISIDKLLDDQISLIVSFLDAKDHNDLDIDVNTLIARSYEAIWIIEDEL